MTHKKYSLFIGRFNGVFHHGHDWLIRQRLDKGHSVLIAIRNVPVDDHNPFAAEEVKEMVEAAFVGEDVKVIVIDDIESVNYGRGLGYDVIEHVPPSDIKAISGTKIREAIANGDSSWKECVPMRVAVWLEKYHQSKG